MPCVQRMCGEITVPWSSFSFHFFVHTVYTVYPLNFLWIPFKVPSVKITRDTKCFSTMGIKCTFKLVIVKMVLMHLYLKSTVNFPLLPHALNPLKQFVTLLI